jgi:hypothetical protein
MLSDLEYAKNLNIGDLRYQHIFILQGQDVNQIGSCIQENVKVIEQDAT